MRHTGEKIINHAPNTCNVDFLMFLPTNRNEMKKLGWESLDVILITGDAYIDSPYFGVAVIGNVLADAGYRVGVISQPNLDNEEDIGRLGEPEIFWGITAGCMDSMVSNYTATKKKRNKDDLTPGGVNNRRPDMATIAYSNLVRKHFKNTRPLVLGGIEASLRRISHYHYWGNSVRRSILFDAKADILIYGMGEKTVLQLAERLKADESLNNIRGICYIGKEKPADYLELHSHEQVKKNKDLFTEMFKTFSANNDPISARGLIQKQDTRYLIQNPPQINPSTQELDHIHELNYEQAAHPCHSADGNVRALDTIRHSIVTHRGCYGQCNFCSIALHQGQTVVSRSEESILREARGFTKQKGFNGIIRDVGGPTANMYGYDCKKSIKKGICNDKRCLTPGTCKTLKTDHSRQIKLLRRLREIPGVRKVFVASGIRHDLILDDRSFGVEYLTEIVKHHISGQLKIAPEHTQAEVLNQMGKPGIERFTEFKTLFDRINKQLGKKQFLTCYFMAAFPGCRESDMHRLKQYSSKVLGFRPQQIQVFTPTPSSIGTLMYYTERSWMTGAPIFVEKDNNKKNRQKAVLLTKQ